MPALAADENFNNCYRLLYLAQHNLPMPRFRPRFRRSIDPFEALQPLVSPFSLGTGRGRLSRSPGSGAADCDVVSIPGSRQQRGTCCMAQWTSQGLSSRLCAATYLPKHGWRPNVGCELKCCSDGRPQDVPKRTGSFPVIICSIIRRSTDFLILLAAKGSSNANVSR